MAIKILIVEDDFDFSKTLMEFLNELLLRIKKVIKQLSLLDDHEKMINALKRLTIEDSLTGLYNHRHFYDQLD